MSEQNYCLIAFAPGRDPVSIKQIAEALARELGRDQRELAAGLAGAGVTVGAALSLPKSLTLSAVVLRAGADFRILDGAGQPVREGKAQAQLQQANATIIGGFHAPAGVSPPGQTAGATPPVRPTSPARPSGEFSGISEADLMTLDEAGGDPALDPAAAKPNAAPQPVGPAASAATVESMAPDPMHGGNLGEVRQEPTLDSLDAGALVLLDGTTERASAAPGGPPPPPHAFTSPGAEGGPELDAAVPVEDAGQFAPPVSDAEFGPDAAGGALELDTDYSAVAFTGPIPPAPPPPEPPATPPDAQAGALAPPPTPPPTAAQTASPRPVHQARLTGPPRPSRSARRRGAFVILGGRLRQRPNARIALGFGVALLLGAALPMCHASSVMSSRVHQLRVELSTAEAYGKVRKASGFTSVEQIEERIGSNRMRGGVVTFLIWLASSATLLFLWFRFT